MEEKVSPSKGLLLTLPKDQFYMGYQDQVGILYLMSSKITHRLITKYHSVFGDRTVPNSVLSYKRKEDDPMGSTGVQVGALFWVIVQRKYNHNVHYNENTKGGNFLYIEEEPIMTWIWFVKRQKWRKGPIIADIDEYAESTSAAINATTAMVMFNDGTIPTRVYDFANEKLVHYPSLEYWEPYAFSSGISLTVQVTKSKRM